MKARYLFLFSFILLVSSTCKKVGDECHYSILFKNSSAETVIFAITNPGDNGCTLDGFNVDPGQMDEYRPFNSCIENRLGSNSNDKIFIYVVNPDSINTPNQYYPCDSIEYYNDILATYGLSLTDLKNIDFVLDYH